MVTATTPFTRQAWTESIAKIIEAAKSTDAEKDGAAVDLETAVISHVIALIKDMRFDGDASFKTDCLDTVIAYLRADMADMKGIE